MPLIETFDYWYTRWLVVRYSWSDWWTWLIGATWQGTVLRLAAGIFVACFTIAMAMRWAQWRKVK